MPKRGENIRKRKDGRWEARIKTDEGKRRSIYAGSYTELKEKIQKTKEQKIKQEETVQKSERPADHQEHTPADKPAYEEICKQWLKSAQIKNKQSTVARYREITEKHLIPFFNETEISQESISAFILYKLNNEKLQPKTICDILSVLVQTIKYASGSGILKGVNLDIARPKLNKKELQILSQAEQKRLVNVIKTNVTYENIGILLSLYTGMRIGEICALLWKDKDLREGTVSITKSMQRIASQSSEQKTKIIIDAPKTQKSIRTIPIPEFLLTEIEKLSKGCSPNAYVLTASEEKFIEPRLYQYKFKKYLEQAQVRNVNFHALRHTFATRAIESEMDIKAASEILGHSTVNFTLERYVHISIDFKKQNMKKMTLYN